MSDVLPRVTGLLLIEVINSNPNGDPDRESDPRQRPDQRGEISPVSFKRKLRDLVHMKDGPVWQEMQRRLQLDVEHFHILETRGRDRPEINRELLQDDGQIFMRKYWDGRIFGNTFLEKKEKAASGDEEAEGKKKGKKDDAEKVKQLETIKTGVVQFGLGLSVAPIRIERHTNTNMSGVQEGKDRGMAPMGYRFVPHGIYAMPFFVNPSQGHKTGCTVKDLELLKAVIPHAYAHTRSHARPVVELIHGWYIEHSNPLGSCSDFDLIRALTPKRKAPVNEPSASRDDYDIPSALPTELASRVRSVTDLMLLM